MYSQDALMVLILASLLSGNELDLNNNNLLLILLLMLSFGYPQFPQWNNGCGCGSCNRNRFFINTI